MGTEFSRRVNAWIAVSGRRGIRGYLVLGPIAQCGKLRRRTGTEGQEDAEEEREIAIKIRTTRHKKHGNGMQQTAAAGHPPAVQQRTHLVVQLSETLHRFPRDLISSSFARKKGERKSRKVEKEKEDVPSAE